VNEEDDSEHFKKVDINQNDENEENELNEIADDLTLINKRNKQK
jgi:hypothetical protein